MDGITNNAYRMICQHIWIDPKNDYNKLYDFFRFTEFMSVEGYIRNPYKLSRHLLTTAWSDKTIAQIYGWDHSNLLQTALDIDAKYQSSFIGIELNIGCPSPKIMACEAWSGMLKCRDKTLQIIQKISKSITKPFSIKTRSGLNSEDRQEQFDFIVESAYYCHLISIHGRTYKQSHSGTVDRQFILDVKQELIRRNLWHVKIIWNGWLKSVKDSLSYIDNQVQPSGSPIHSRLDGIMLGQAAMCNPWSLVSYTPSIQDIYITIHKHLHLSLANEYYFSQVSSFDHKDNILQQPCEEQLYRIARWIQNQTLNIEHGKWFSLIEFRKHLFWYINWLPNCSEFKRTVATVTEYPQLLFNIHHYFQSILPWISNTISSEQLLYEGYWLDSNSYSTDKIKSVTTAT